MSRQYPQMTTSFLERLSFVTPRRQWFSIGFIFVVLLGLVALPFLLSHRTHTILSQRTEQIDVASSLGDGIHSAFSRELTAIVGFQQTGDANYIQSYKDEERAIRASIAQLEPLTVRLGVTVQIAFRNLQSAIENWHNRTV